MAEAFRVANSASSPSPAGGTLIPVLLYETASYNSLVGKTPDGITLTRTPIYIDKIGGILVSNNDITFVPVGGKVSNTANVGYVVIVTHKDGTVENITGSGTYDYVITENDVFVMAAQK